MSESASDGRRVALVTGASRGIGAATAATFARKGYNVALVARGREGLEAAAKQVEAAGGEALVVAGDLGDLDFAKSAVDATVAKWGRVDALVNNAAWREITTMRQISIESWEKTLRVCLTTPAFLAKWCAEHMQRQGGGAIINISSVQSERVSGHGPAYVACKGAIDTLTYELAVLYGPHNIRAVSLQPGAIDTEMSGDYKSADGEDLIEQLRRESEDTIPLRRWGTSDEIAKTIVWLASDEASYITGTTILADGGVRIQWGTFTQKKQMFPEDFQ